MAKGSDDGMLMSVFQDEAQELMEWCVKERLPGLFMGPPGCGKTSMLKEVADKLYGPPKREIVKRERLGTEIEVVTRPYYHAEFQATADETDLPGVPFVSMSSETLKRARPEWVPAPEYPEGVIGLDDIGQARMQVQNGDMQLINEYRVGEWILPPGWSLVAMSNDAKHRSGAIEMNRALLDRFYVVVNVTVNPEKFREKAVQMNFHPTVTSFMKLRPTLIQAFDPEVKKSPTCRGAEQLSEILWRKAPERTMPQVVSGIQGGGYATEFLAFRRLMNDIVTPEDIMRDPKGVKIVQNKPDLMYATMGALEGFLREGATPDMLTNAIIYGKRIPAEYGMVLARDLMTHNREVMLNLKPMREWIMENRGILQA